MADLTAALLLFLFPLAYSPGPGNLFFAAIGARFGLGATLPANAGYHIATWAVAVAVGLGFSELIARAPALFEGLRVAGAVYVIWLAVRLLRAGSIGDPGDARPAGFVDGAALLLLNPKAWLIMMLMFTQFLAGQRGDPATVLWIATVFTLNNLVAFLVWTVLGDRLAALFRDRAGARRLNTAFGLVLAGVAGWMLLG
jgi:threonine/homoserine/homoserine lactone efflux protein